MRNQQDNNKELIPPEAYRSKQVHDVSLIDVVNKQCCEIQQLKEYIKRLEKI